MTTNNYPNIGKITHGRDFNFYQKVQVVSTSFGGNTVDGQQPDVVITFTTQSVMFLNENTTGTVEYSFNGSTVHGELDPTLPSRAMTFDNRTVSCIWFRVKSGSTGPITVRVDAWATR
jgi:hypothetical protein